MKLPLDEITKKKLTLQLAVEIVSVIEKGVFAKVKNIEDTELGLFGHCPICDKYCLNSNYCPNCGQRLDWGSTKLR